MSQFLSPLPRPFILQASSLISKMVMLLPPISEMAMPSKKRAVGEIGDDECKIVAPIAPKKKTKTGKKKAKSQRQQRRA